MTSYVLRALNNDKVRLAAVDATDRLLESVSAPLLVQHVSHCVSHGVSRAKPVLLQKLIGLVQAVHPTRPQLVTKHVLPAAIATLMNESRGRVVIEHNHSNLEWSTTRIQGECFPLWFLHPFNVRRVVVLNDPSTRGGALRQSEAAGGASGLPGAGGSGGSRGGGVCGGQAEGGGRVRHMLLATS